MMNQQLSQKQKLKILPQQIQLLNFFQLNSLELEHRITQELEENPLLEEKKEDEVPLDEKYSKDSVKDYQDWDEYGYDDIPDYKLEYRNYLPDENTMDRPVAESSDFRRDLKQQFQLMVNTQEELEIGNYLIDSLNECGMLDLELERIAEDYSFKNKVWIEEEKLLSVLEKIQQLDPPGIGSRDTRECLLLQLQQFNKKRPDIKIALELMNNWYNDLKSRNLEKIKSQLNIDEEELRIVLQLLASLKMKPIAETVDQWSNQYIIPDFVVTLNGDEPEVHLYRQRSDGLFINMAWKESLMQSTKDKEAVQYCKNKLQSAQWFITAVKEREGNMLNVMKAILKLQKDYFREGDIKLLKPMILKNVADIVGLDISTVSRIASNKYAETHFGTILLKDIFTEGIINEEGKAISNRVIQEAIGEVIESEDKKTPYTDQQLVVVLARKGFSVARRTIAKYREQMHIPVAQLRGVWG
ncbi:MAG: RNA polymerase factor sigma-54 [Chitinophagaceae bacterium]